MEKAEGVAARIGRLDEAEYHYCRARITEKRHDARAAEQELRTAMQLAPRQAGRVVDLARFLAKQGRYEESDELFRRAGNIAPDSPRVVFERAATYLHSGRNLEIAKDLLRRYTELPLSPDDPPRSEAARLLAKASQQPLR
jgi:Tfp pilus assembly protein PilF